MTNSGNSRAFTRRDLLRGMAAFGCAAVASKATFGAGGTGGAPAPTPVRFALLGDWGSGDDSQMAIGERMAAAHSRSALDMVISAGDNIYPNGSAENFRQNFERPFAELIRNRVPFYTCFGNHDVRDGAEAQMRYPLFNMNGQSYYRVTAGRGMIELFMLDTNMMDARQINWLDSALGESTAVWKIPVFHHPIYSSGKKHGSDESLRRVLEPVFVRHSVPVVFSGHDHVYQRVTPQQGVQYFVSGAGGKIRAGNLKRDTLVAAGYDGDSHFMVLEADASRFKFKAINSQGETIDQGQLAAPASSVSRFLRRRFAAA